MGPLKIFTPQFLPRPSLADTLLLLLKLNPTLGATYYACLKYKIQIMLVSSLKYKIQIMLVSSLKYKIHMHARPSGAFYGRTCIFSLDAGDAGGADTKYKCTRHNCRLLRLFVQTVLAKKLHKRARTSRQKKDVRWKHEVRIPH